MKKEYEQPCLEVVEFQFTEHIACSSGYSHGDDDDDDDDDD
ncbi:MAG: hypothetical protein ACYCWE_16995 [Eubacteriales bacterium]